MNDLSEKELLMFAVEGGIIDLNTLRMQIEMKERGKYLEMHQYKIWKGSDGKWHTYLPKKGGGRVSRKRNTKEEIIDIVVEYWRSEKEIHTLQAVFYEWLEKKLKYGEIEKSTYDKYETDFFRFFDSKMRERDIKYITEEVLEDFIKASICEKNLSSKGYAGLRTLINGMFKHGKKRGYTDVSISSFFGDIELSRKIFKKKVKCKEKEVFSEEEIKKMVCYVLKKGVKVREAGILLAIYTGMRPGELSTLKVSDIDLKNRTIHVQRSEVKYKGKHGECIIDVREFPKTEAGDRYLVLSDKALEMAKKAVRLNPFGEYLFEDERTRKRISVNGFNHKLRRLCDSVDIPVRTMHKLRKTYGTTLIDNRVDDSIIMAQMGHADIRTTRKYYYYSNQDDAEILRQLNMAHAN